MGLHSCQFFSGRESPPFGSTLKQFGGSYASRNFSIYSVEFIGRFSSGLVGPCPWTVQSWTTGSCQRRERWSCARCDRDLDEQGDEPDPVDRYKRRGFLPLFISRSRGVFDIG